MSMKPVVVILALGLAAVACSKPDTNPNPKAESAQPAQAAAAPAAAGAKDLFAQRCATCHGTSGKGDGAAAAALNPKPRDYTNKEWQASITDEQLKKVIVAGGAAVGKSGAMPPNPDLDGKPELEGLIAIVRAFGK